MAAAAAAAAQAAALSGDQVLNLYVHDYLTKHNFRKAAQTLAQEAGLEVGAEVPIDAPQSLLFEWWTIFWAIFQERSPTSENPSQMSDARLYNQQTELRRQAAVQAIMRGTSAQPVPPQPQPGGGRPGLAGTASVMMQGYASPHAPQHAAAPPQFSSPFGPAPGAPPSQAQGMAPSPSPAMQNNQMLLARAVAMLGWTGRPLHTLSPEERARLSGQVTQLSAMEQQRLRQAAHTNGPGSNDKEMEAMQHQRQQQQMQQQQQQLYQQQQQQQHQQQQQQQQQQRQQQIQLQQQQQQQMMMQQQQQQQKQQEEQEQQLRAASPGGRKRPRKDSVNSRGGRQQQPAQPPQPNQPSPSPGPVPLHPANGATVEQMRLFEEGQELARSLQRQSRGIIHNAAPNSGGGGANWASGEPDGGPKTPQSAQALSMATSHAHGQIDAQIAALQQQQQGHQGREANSAQISQLRRLQGRISQTLPGQPQAQQGADLFAPPGARQHSPGGLSNGAQAQAQAQGRGGLMAPPPMPGNKAEGTSPQPTPSVMGPPPSPLQHNVPQLMSHHPSMRSSSGSGSSGPSTTQPVTPQTGMPASFTTSPGGLNLHNLDPALGGGALQGLSMDMHGWTGGGGGAEAPGGFMGGSMLDDFGGGAGAFDTDDFSFLNTSFDFGGDGSLKN